MYANNYVDYSVEPPPGCGFATRAIVQGLREVDFAENAGRPEVKLTALERVVQETVALLDNDEELPKPDQEVVSVVVEALGGHFLAVSVSSAILSRNKQRFYPRLSAK